MDDDYRNVFNDSFERCAKDEQFLDRFYTLFIDCNDEVRELFRHTDMARQKELLMITLSYMMLARSTPELLDRVAARHSRHNLDIRPHLYVTWLDCMLAAVHQTDPKFSREVDAAWRATLKPGIDYLMRHYDPEDSIPSY